MGMKDVKNSVTLRTKFQRWGTNVSVAPEKKKKNQRTYTLGKNQKWATQFVQLSLSVRLNI